MIPPHMDSNIILFLVKTFSALDFFRRTQPEKRGNVETKNDFSNDESEAVPPKPTRQIPR